MAQTYALPNSQELSGNELMRLHFDVIAWRGNGQAEL